MPCSSSFVTSARSSSVISIIDSTRPNHRLKNFRVPGAAAKISRQTIANLSFVWTRIFLQQVHRRQNHSWRADAALRAAAFNERLLHGVQLLRTRNPLDGLN